jgi:3-hydroxyanthranilate 3,4-dioxygenase
MHGAARERAEERSGNPEAQRAMLARSLVCNRRIQHMFISGFATQRQYAYHTRIIDMRPIRPIHFQHWIDSNRHLLRPPVGNKVVYPDGEFIIMVVGGPNSRKDFHVDPAEEFFHQLEGEMVLRVASDGRIEDVPIRAGEILLLPAGVPHSPQRSANSVGLVVERQRRAGELDGLQWYCERCQHLLYEEYFQLTDIERQFPPVFQRFFGSPSLRTCSQCGAVMQPPPAAGPGHAAQ